MTHLLWDSFTHRDTFATEAFPLLLGPVPGFSWMPIYHLLHGLSSVVGLVILVFWARHLHRQPARSLIRPYKIGDPARLRANGFLLVAAVAGALIEWIPCLHRRYDAQLFAAAVGLMSGFFIAWCAVAIGLWILARRSRGR